MRPTTLLLITFPAILGFSSMPTSPAFGRDSLTVSANAPTVRVAPRAAGRHFLRLPALEYSFELLASCTGGRQPAAVSLSVADSRKTLNSEELRNGGIATINLQIPPAQIAPLPVADFCVVDVPGEETTRDPSDNFQLAISSALSAQISLLCEDEDDQAMTYVSKALDVLLSCEMPPTESDGETVTESGENP